MSILDHLREESIRTKMTPLDLLEAQEAANRLREHNLPEADEILSIANQELIRRGRCTICGQRHESALCPRIAAIKARLMGDKSNEGPTEGGVLV